MHPDIRAIVSDFAYDGLLRDSGDVLQRTADLAAKAPFGSEPIVWCDVGALGSKRFSDHARSSRFNPISAFVSFRLAIEARQAGFERVVILTPYRPQARLLASLVKDAHLSKVEVGTIHRFQGSEAPAVIVDLVDGTGMSAGRPFHDTDGERLLTVALSRAQGKLLVVGNRKMPLQGLSPRTRRLLSRLPTVRFVTPDRPWRATGKKGFSIEMREGIPKAIQDMASGEVTAAWLPDRLPPELQKFDGPHADPWPNGHVTILGRAGALTLLARDEAGRWQSFSTAGTPGFAEALAKAVSGAPLAARNRVNGKSAPAGAVRHDRCANCGGSVMPESSGYDIDLECRMCTSTRKAVDREINAWLREVGPCCPECGEAMVARRSRHGPFLGCSTYPQCEGTERLDRVCEAALIPDRPRVVRRPTTRAAKGAGPPTRVCQQCWLKKPATLFEGDGTVCADCS